jgi:nitrate reductase delta subunit
METPTHDSFADLFRYPDITGKDRVLAAATALRRGDDELEAILEPFEQMFRHRDAIDLEELYTHTFDINPVCSLEVGWHLFGEDYSRGAFLVRMRERMRQVGVEETSELPDHLPQVLAVLGRVPDDEGKSLSCEFVLPAVNKMLAGLGEKKNEYRAVLEAVRSFLLRRYGEASPTGVVAGQPYEGCSSCPALEGDPHG